MIQILSLVVVGFVVDVLSILWTRAIIKDGVGLTIVVGAMFTGMVLFANASVVKDPWMAIPYIGGGAVGTYVGMKIRLRKNEDK